MQAREIVGKLMEKLQISYTNGTIQEYPTEPLDKIPACQGEFELAGRKKLAK